MTNEEAHKARLEAVGKFREMRVGQIIKFTGLTGERARYLLTAGYADPSNNQNDSPNFEQITQFLEAHPKFFGHGYIVPPTRPDDRITLEGVIAKCPLSAADIEAFKNAFSDADEFRVSESSAYAWYD